ncbi:hypothetical protein C427_1503 [Paraglaciecola psychrophila 170]|jgi:hypothetical protein|uniref:Uncharacterized protein n=1 Tax=Paraglaciecola psychrophila 170 TaxID=1129794 RepID=K7ABQ1_9ALTE|nr:hypothetical protein C427_1503 [Paraglaciecola psychrophila 170]GAC39717.1 hypothetical protein GPSY_4106 [Paraglaciecola psychrophila 170]
MRVINSVIYNRDIEVKSEQAHINAFIESIAFENNKGKSNRWV